MNKTGEIVFPKELIVQWKIKEFSSLSEHICYDSSSFSFAFESWCLRIFPIGVFKDGIISIFLRQISSGSIKFEFSFSLKTTDEKKVLEKHKAFFGKNEYFAGGFLDFLSRSELLKRKSELLPSDTLTVICSLKWPDCTNIASEIDNKDEVISGNKLSSHEEYIAKKKVSSKMKGFEILSENLKQMFLDEKMCDAILKIEDRKFNVHKFILVARSPVFASMFQHDLAEKNTNEVDIPDCTPESFQVFLHYLYSGSGETLSTSTVYNVYYSADKYQVDDLKEKCVNFMMENISAETFCDVIALSLRHGEAELQKFATDFFCLNIRKIIKTVQWQKYLDENSTQANELLIKALNA